MIDIAPDPRPISALLVEKGISFSEFSVRNGVLIIRLTEEPSIETIVYLATVAECLGFKSTHITFKGMTLFVGG